jgi:hypothetical protein
VQNAFLWSFVSCHGSSISAKVCLNMWDECITACVIWFDSVWVPICICLLIPINLVMACLGIRNLLLKQPKCMFLVLMDRGNGILQLSCWTLELNQPGSMRKLPMNINDQNWKNHFCQFFHFATSISWCYNFQLSRVLGYVFKPFWSMPCHLALFVGFGDLSRKL